MSYTWPEVIFFLGVLILVTFLISVFTVGMFESRKSRRQADAAEELRGLVERFEELARSTVETQERMAAELAELRSRTESIERILRTVE
ncbi:MULTISPECIES: hypothetical protein [Nonomuraea]|uniref:Uncharacterized protein n=2 Tax=Nonomuraea TaxID=83681 RepID=A0A7X0P7S6_9ACTN|nr:MULTISPECIES: hypothetical protein [Nonomuraea]MBB6556811.1 hypothetical protein [Nonomuraea rubra]MCP2363196.1 hypothetical protein [Nonomuraea thailandensis]